MANIGARHTSDSEKRESTAQLTRFFRDHTILRHSARGRRWFTIDDDARRFDTAQAAVSFIRTLEPAIAA